ncbi:MAG: bifunctional (p)ppGpp synthetase/guanosine-3',5'-bis(diphosphate) 3'-pyrophosphohydrolase [Bacteroidetes bacterium]|nr:bifunctional (p)ppGpp synthetase/guanosine-3',5'-bis(diphosphate) 3'-pyrophosphohydrolase [Bacteroidota bacterium]
MINNSTVRLLKAMAFAADKHRFQKRKDSAGTPYINHPIHVAQILAETGRVEDETLLIAAILHDTIEDTETRPEEIRELFGQDVLDIVMEVTDDKSLPKAERKKLQVTQSSKKSESARKLKIADKICNVTDIIHHPPGNWDTERRLEYLDWCEQVLHGIRGTHDQLEDQLIRIINEGRAIIGSEQTVH